MQNLLKAEELLMCAAGIYGIIWLAPALPWWLLVLLFFAPDIGMIGYLAGPRVGAVTYNLLHHKGIAVMIWGIGIMSGNAWLSLAGCLMFAHASFDRVLGYGLKYADAFAHTHLGAIGKTRST